jgi:hypothetical protein
MMSGLQKKVASFLCEYEESSDLASEAAAKLIALVKTDVEKRLLVAIEDAVIDEFEGLDVEGLARYVAARIARTAVYQVYT